MEKNKIFNEKEYKHNWYLENKERVSAEKKDKYRLWRLDNPIQPRKRRKTTAQIVEGNKRRERINYLKYKELDPEFSRFQHLKKRYKLTKRQYQDKLESQDYKCAICGIHEKEASRGML